MTLYQNHTLIVTRNLIVDIFFLIETVSINFSLKNHFDLSFIREFYDNFINRVSKVNDFDTKDRVI